MLTVLDALADEARTGLAGQEVDRLSGAPAQIVSETTAAQESLRRANVVDSGALGMLVFLDGMLRVYFGLGQAQDALAGRFRSLVRFDRAGCARREPKSGSASTRSCACPRPSDADACPASAARWWSCARRAVEDPPARAPTWRWRGPRWAGWAKSSRWSWDDLHEQMSTRPAVANSDDVHIVTDGAASLSRREAEALGMTLLDSHIDLGDRSLPETRLTPEDLTVPCAGACACRPRRRRPTSATCTTSGWRRSGKALSICAWDRSTPATTRWRWLGDRRIPPAPA